MKQETLEEVTERYVKGGNTIICNDLKEAIKFGAKWQSERMYTEKEVMDMFHNLSMHLPLHYEFLVREQFKK